MDFGRFIRERRERLEFSLRELGEKCEMDHTYLHRLETGEKMHPSEEKLAALFRHLSVVGDDEAAARFLVEKGEVDDNLFEILLNREEDFSEREISLALEVKQRGRNLESKEEWLQLLREIRELLG